MRGVTENAQFRVQDGVLSPQAFADLQRLLGEATFEKVHQPGRGYAWRPEDGEPTATPPCFHDSPEPWASPLFEVLLQPEAFLPLVSTTWKAVSARAFKHSAGSGLSWHTDDPGYAGAWIYFAHPAWDCHWGGELLMADPSCQGRQWRQSGEASLRSETALVGEVGVGSWLFPKPNRLVVIAAGQMHRVNPVTAGAGGQARTTVSGFFLRA